MKKKVLFGSILETSIRVLILLDELKNKKLTENQICCIDFISTYASDFNLLDENLHANNMFRFSEFSSRVIGISRSLKRLVLDLYIDFIPSKNGYCYSINSSGEKVIKNIKNYYTDEYRIAIREVLNKYIFLNEKEMQNDIYIRITKSLEVCNE